MHTCMSKDVYRTRVKKLPKCSKFLTNNNYHFFIYHHRRRKIVLFFLSSWHLILLSWQKNILIHLSHLYKNDFNKSKPKLLITREKHNPLVARTTTSRSYLLIYRYIEVIFSLLNHHRACAKFWWSLKFSGWLFIICSVPSSPRAYTCTTSFWFCIRKRISTREI